MKNILILSPLKLEKDALLSRMHERGYESTESKVGPLKVIEFPKLGYRFALAGHGKTQFGIQTQFLIHQLPNLDAVICAGSSGGLAEEVKVFDVVAASKTIEHDYRLKFIKRPDPEFSGDEKLLAKVKNLNVEKYKIHIGPIASGDEDIIETERATELRAQTKALAVAWEGAGGARACKFNNVPFLELRGVTDTASNTAPIDFANNLKVAMANVCDTLLAID